MADRHYPSIQPSLLLRQPSFRVGNYYHHEKHANPDRVSNDVAPNYVMLYLSLTDDDPLQDQIYPGRGRGGGGEGIYSSMFVNGKQTAAQHGNDRLTTWRILSMVAHPPRHDQGDTHQWSTNATSLGFPSPQTLEKVEEHTVNRASETQSANQTKISLHGARAVQKSRDFCTITWERRHSPVSREKLECPAAPRSMSLPRLPPSLLTPIYGTSASTFNIDSNIIVTSATILLERISTAHISPR